MFYYYIKVVIYFVIFMHLIYYINLVSNPTVYVIEESSEKS